MPLAVMVEHLANYGMDDAAVDKVSEAVATRTTFKAGSSDKIKAHCCFGGVKGWSDMVKGCCIADYLLAEGARGEVSY